MNIGVFTDLRFVSYPYPTGVGKHITQMVQGLSKVAGNDLSLLAATDQVGRAGSLSFLPVRALPLRTARSSVVLIKEMRSGLPVEVSAADPR